MVDDGVILINMSWSAHAEAQADGHPYRVKKAAQQILTIDTGDADAGLAAKVGAALFLGGPQNDNQRNDVLVVCEAIKWHATLVDHGWRVEVAAWWHPRQPRQAEVAQRRHD